ncbi:60S acidic ribosomal protein P2 isoform X1 [Silurus meridionalis]|nr:60S acidic ribosomal protein P2 isoform X1 [Silurus meridionalis]
MAGGSLTFTPPPGAAPAGVWSVAVPSAGLCCTGGALSETLEHALTLHGILESSGALILYFISEKIGKMRYVAAYLLAALGGKENPSGTDIKKILESVGIEADETRMKKVVSELNGKSVEDVIAQGYSKLASVPSGGAVAVAASGAPAAGGAAAPAAAAEEKKEEKKEESEESDDDMGFGLFD